MFVRKRAQKDFPIARVVAETIFVVEIEGNVDGLGEKIYLCLYYTKFIAKFLHKKEQEKELIEILNLELKQLNFANIEVILMVLYGKKK